MKEPYYSDDLVTIYCGDWRDVAPTLVGVDLVLTDPPYGVGVRTEYRAARPNKSGTARWASRDHRRIAGDDRPFDPAPFLSYPGVVLWGANHYADKLPASSSWLVWDKIAGLHTDKREHGFNDMPDAELAWTNAGGTVRTFRHAWMGLLRASENGQRVLHPTQKPVALMAWCLSFFPDARLVFDPFMGSGPVARACKDRGIRYVGCELVEEYCERAAERCRQEVLDLGGAA